MRFSQHYPIKNFFFIDKVGKKLIIGDNLASHLSPTVIDLCRENNIEFVCLPPNSTDKLQPLDVGVFGPLKANWRRILTSYKEKHPNQVGMPKNDFPFLLATLLKEADPGKHLPAAFDKCSLYPVNPERGMERIPSRDMPVDLQTTRELLDSTLGEKLEALRGIRSDQKPKQRGKKIKIAPGKSYCADPDTDSSEEAASEEEASEEEASEEEASEEEVSEEEASEEEAVDDIQQFVEERRKGGLRALSESEEDQMEVEQLVGGGDTRGGRSPVYPVGSYVVAMYDNEWYVAQVEAEEPENECEGFTLLVYMERKGPNQFMWGTTRDSLKTINRDILLRVDPPIPVSSRLMGLPKNIVKDIEKLLRVKWSIIELHFHIGNLAFLPSGCPILSKQSCPVKAVLSSKSSHITFFFCLSSFSYTIR